MQQQVVNTALRFRLVAQRCPRKDMLQVEKQFTLFPS